MHDSQTKTVSFPDQEKLQEEAVFRFVVSMNKTLK